MGCGGGSTGLHLYYMSESKHVPTRWAVLQAGIRRLAVAPPASQKRRGVRLTWYRTLFSSASAREQSHS